MTSKMERLPNEPGVAATGRTEAFSDVGSPSLDLAGVEPLRSYAST